MNWLSFFIGVLVGWLLGWLIDYFFCRPGRLAAEAELKGKLAHCDEECAALKAQLAGYQDLQVRLDAASAELEGLKGRAVVPDLSKDLAGANRQQFVLLDELNSAKSVQAQLDSANYELQMLKAQLAGGKNVQADLLSCKAHNMELELEIQRLKAELAGRSGVAPAAAAVATAAGIAAAPVAAEPVTPDDLILIEGIGPKINGLLNKAGIFTFAQLAATAVAHLQSILDAAGPRYRLADPKTWPEQAALARDGKWEAFKALQETLKAGREV